MKKKHPTPLGARLLIQTDKVKIGNFEVNTPTARETATVIAVGEGWDMTQEAVKVGDRIHVKSFAFDVIVDGDETYNYVWQQSGAVCGIIK
jgi:co-chaperonin GroES (HSP10)